MWKLRALRVPTASVEVGVQCSDNALMTRVNSNPYTLVTGCAPVCHALPFRCGVGRSDRRHIGLWLTVARNTSYGACVHAVVTVGGGRVRGVWRGDLWSFSGIPYARAPIGQLRWQPPQPPMPWNDVRSAAAFGPIAPQRVAEAGITSPSDPGADDAQSEDCLTLNIWTPDIPEVPTIAPGSGRPVMVWIHGGGFTSGSGSVLLYHGTELVRHGDVVVVTINYRLGALGFLGHRALESPEGYVGNWGLHDQVAALRWVRDNIAQFGGDANLVTVFGESAGGFSLPALMGAPAARGLFRRAIVQSGGVHVHSITEAERAADRLAAVLGVPDCTRQSLGSVPFGELVVATEEVGKRPPDPGLIALPFLPVVDGVFLPQNPLTAVESGAASGIDLLIGTNRDELALFGLGRPELMGLDENGVIDWAATAAPDVPGEELLEGYRAARLARSEDVDARSLMVALGTDAIFRWPSLQLAAAQGAHEARTFVYLFEWESPAFGGLLGSCHALELPFVFGVVHVAAVQMFTGAGAEVELLSRQMQQAWLAFARTGDPSHSSLKRWPLWDPTQRSTMVFGPRTGAVERPRDDELAVWERYRPLFAAALG
jgi:para-nitrobenzyl esterase